MDWADIFPVSIWALSFLISMAFFAGFIDSIAGGGGLISLPATLVAGLPAHMALGTGKFMASVGTTASLIAYARKGAVVWRIVAFGLLFSLVGSFMGSKTALLVSNEILGKVLLWLLPVAVVATFLPAREEHQELRQGWVANATIMAVCLAVGFYDGFFGPATGSIMLLALHYTLRLGLISSSATAKAFNLASNVGSMIIFIINGKVLYSVAIPMAAANMTGNIIGTRLAIKSGPRIVRVMLVVALGLLFATLVYRYYIKAI